MGSRADGAPRLSLNRREKAYSLVRLSERDEPTNVGLHAEFHALHLSQELREVVLDVSRRPRRRGHDFPQLQQVRIFAGR